uniref:Uncharacterized protein n=1 Tax=Sphaerodactylus townsendi TaxID=933632 RepID=A0ACB8G884_9SAUR
MVFPDFRPLRSSSPEQDGRDNERGHQAHADLWGPSRPPRLPMTRRYRSRGSTRPDRSPAIEGIIQQIFAGFFANSAIPGSPHPFSWGGMLHSNPGDYAWGQSGLDAIVTQLLGQLENTGPPQPTKRRFPLSQPCPSLRNKLGGFSGLPVHLAAVQRIQALGCPMCKEDYTIAEQVRQLPCNHYFHSSCMGALVRAAAIPRVRVRKSLSGGIPFRQTLNSK